MEKVSAMKKVALFLMIVGLAVAMVACQGAVGPKGDKGDQGDPGTPGTEGTAGTPGTPGIDALGEKPGADKSLAFNNAVASPESDAVSALTISMHDYFVGGNEPMFSATGGGTDVALAWDDAGVELTITVTRNAQGEFPSGTTAVTLTAKDDDGRSAEVVVTLRANEPPTASNTLANLRIGLQQDKLTPARNAPSPPGRAILPTFAPRPWRSLFEAPSGEATDDVLTYEATSDDTSKVVASVDGDMLTITAIATTAVTADTTTTNGEDQAVEVTLKATDAGGLSVTHGTPVSVLVDSPPTLENAVPHAATYALTEDTLVMRRRIPSSTQDELGPACSRMTADGIPISSVTAPSSDDDIADGGDLR